MPDRPPTEIVTVWKSMKDSAPDGFAEDAVERLRGLLKECVAAGAEVLDQVLRNELQRVAREIADVVFRITGDSPPAVIDQPLRAFSPDDWPLGSELPAPAKPPRVLVASALVVAAVVLFGLVLGALYVDGAVRDRNQLRSELDTVRTLAAADKNRAADALSTEQNKVAELRLARQNLETQLKTARAEFDAERETTKQKLEKATKLAGKAPELAGSFDEAKRVGRALRRSLWSAFDRLPLEEQEKLARNTCLEVIRACQIVAPGAAKGAFAMNSGGASLWIVPARGNLAALALLSEHATPGRAGEAADLEAVRAWIMWYTEHQNSDTGEIPNFDYQQQPSKLTARTDNDPDAAAGYLLVVWRFYDRTKEELPAPVRTGAKLALKAVLGRIDTIKAVTQPTAYLMSAVSDYGGLNAAAHLFRGIDKEAAQQAAEAAKWLGALLKQFRQPQSGRFAWSISKGVTDPQLTNLYPDVAANLYGLAWIAPDDRRVWEVVKKDFKPGDESEPFVADCPAPVELWLAAAHRVGPEAEVNAWKHRARRAAVGFGPHTYVHRPAVTLLTLLEGASWLPSVSEAENLKLP